MANELGVFENHISQARAENPSLSPIPLGNHLGPSEPSCIVHGLRNRATRKYTAEAAVRRIGAHRSAYHWRSLGLKSQSGADCSWHQEGSWSTHTRWTSVVCSTSSQEKRHIKAPRIRMLTINPKAIDAKRSNLTLVDEAR